MGRTGGVQALVASRMLDVPRDAPIAVFGLGEIGRAMLRSLADAGFTAVESFNRASMRAFEGAVDRAHTVIVASGAPHAWLTLPAGHDRRVFDLGSPLQIVAAPGWQLTALDELLASVAPGAVVTHRWAASVGYTQDALPFLGEVREGVWAAGGYCGTGNVIGALCARQLVSNVLGGPDYFG